MPRIKLTLTVLLLTFFSFTNSVLAQTVSLAKFDRVDPASDYQDSIDKTRQKIQLMLDRGVPGVSIAISVAGETVWAEGFGYANVEHRVPVTTLTKFRVGSVAKPMTTFAMMSLLEEGVVDLDVPIQTYLPEFPAKAEGEITLRLLAMHRAGVRHYLPDSSDVFIRDHYDDVVEALDLFADDPLVAPPGEKYSYSSYGYNLISAVLQEASGEDFLSLMDRRVFAPLHMRNSMADQVDLIIENRAAPYELDDNGKIRNSPYVDNSYKWAGGGFLSTPSDLVQFAYGVFNSDILSEQSQAMLLPPPTLADGTEVEQRYGLGWQLIGDSGDWFGHGGGSVGGNTAMAFNPQLQIAIAVVCNQSGCIQGDVDWTEVIGYFVAQSQQ